MPPTLWARYTKWDGSLHWRFPVVPLSEDAHGHWLGAGPGTPLQRGDAAPIASPAFVLLVPRDRWWTAVWNDPSADSPFPYRVYADICTPAVWTSDGVTMVDLDLDVVLRYDDEISIRDEDEFIDHGRRWRYPRTVRRSARAAAKDLVARLGGGLAPFDGSADAHLEQARRLR